MCQALAKKDGTKVTKTIIDVGESANNMKRAGLRKIISLVKARKIDVLYLSSIDRLARNFVNYTKLNRLFKQYGVLLKTENRSEIFEDSVIELLTNGIKTARKL